MEQSDNDEVGAASLSPKRVNSREKSVGYHIKTSIPDLDLRSVISTLEKTEANLEKNGCSSLLVAGVWRPKYGQRSRSGHPLGSA
jgi:hypothetical protein